MSRPTARAAHCCWGPGASHQPFGENGSHFWPQWVRISQEKGLLFSFEEQNKIRIFAQNAVHPRRSTFSRATATPGLNSGSRGHSLTEQQTGRRHGEVQKVPGCPFHIRVRRVVQLPAPWLHTAGLPSVLAEWRNPQGIQEERGEGKEGGTGLFHTRLPQPTVKSRVISSQWSCVTAL